ncbi:MAG: hypothetical protein IIB33_03470 [Chloroflexi bacterium]|nr:hypothetical protein [Chloroflexota bacterium]
MPDLSPDDHYQLRKAQNLADKKTLEAQRAQGELERLVLELEHRYELMNTGQIVDPRSAAIQMSAPEGNGNGNGVPEALFSTELQEAPAGS